MPISDAIITWIKILALIFYAQACSVCLSIRYGFLADAFTKKKVPGRVYGLVGTSIAAGYFLMFITGLNETIMRKWNSKVILASNVIGFAIVALITGFAYSIPNTSAIITISIVMRVVQGLLAYTCTVAPVDFINAQFPDKFDMVNGLLNMGYFSGHGIAEALGSIIYDHLGYEAAYVFSALIALMAGAGIYFFIPNCKTYLSTQQDLRGGDVATQGVELNSESLKLTKLLIVPMVATMLINANHGVLQVFANDKMSNQNN